MVGGGGGGGGGGERKWRSDHISLRGREGERERNHLHLMFIYTQGVLNHLHYVHLHGELENEISYTLC